MLFSIRLTSPLSSLGFAAPMLFLAGRDKRNPASPQIIGDLDFLHAPITLKLSRTLTACVSCAAMHLATPVIQMRRAWGPPMPPSYRLHAATNSIPRDPGDGEA